MRSFLDQLFRDQEPYLFSLADVLLAMTVAALLTFVLAAVYRATHRGTSYSQAYLQTLFLMSVATAVVMMIIGSNIARAFSLVGALSIIRFRTAVKDARDTGFLFAAIAVGMGCGTQFFMPVIAFTGFVAVMVLAIHYLDFGRKGRPDCILRVTFVKEGEGASAVEPTVREVFKEPRLLNRLADLEDGRQTNVYAVRLSGTDQAEEVETRLRGLPGVEQVALYERDQQEGEE